MVSRFSNGSALTGSFPDGLGNNQKAPDRIDFEPFPWQSAAIWILTQIKRWGYIKEDVDYKRIAEQVFLASDCRQILETRGFKAPESNYERPSIMGKQFDPDKPEEYVKSFSIKRS